MRTETEMNERILGITKTIREEYPELLNFLNEMPITIPHKENPKVTISSLSSYYDSLVNLVEDYKANKG